MKGSRRTGRSLVGMTTRLAPAMTVMAALMMATVHLPVARARDIPLIKNAEERVVGAAGSTVLLPCLADGEPEPLVEWYRGHQQVTRTWARFRVTHRGLRIKEAALEDSALYVCKAINGFGTAQIKIELVITGESSDARNGHSFEHLEPPNIHGPPPLTGSRPVVTAVTRQHTLQRPREASVRLRCDVSGDPAPKMHWLKDGRPLLMSYDDTHTHPPRLGRYTLPLDNLVPEDSGVYMCLAHNSFGTANASFTLEVVDRLKKKPELTGLDPLNTTVLRGDTASFQCRVRSQVTPSIQWLKRMEGEEARQANTTIVLHGERYRVLKASDVLAHNNGEYLNKLVIPHAMPSHAGMYVCWGANSMGYNIRSAFLTVRSPPEVKHHPSDKGNPTITNFTRFPTTLFIVVPMGVVIIAAVVAICFLRRRRRQRCKTIRQPRTSALPPQPPPPTSMPPLLPMRRSSPCPPPLCMRDANPGCRSWSPPVCAYPGPPPSLRSEATSLDSRPLPQQRPLLLNY